MCNTVFPGRGHGVSHEPWDQSPCCSPGTTPHPEGGLRAVPAPSSPLPPPARQRPSSPALPRSPGPDAVLNEQPHTLLAHAGGKGQRVLPGEAEAQAGWREMRAGGAVFPSNRLLPHLCSWAWGPLSAGPEAGMLEGPWGGAEAWLWAAPGTGPLSPLLP